MKGTQTFYHQTMIVLGLIISGAAGQQVFQASSSFTVDDFGIIPKDRQNTFTQDEAKARCKIMFGPSYDLAVLEETNVQVFPGNMDGNLDSDGNFSNNTSQGEGVGTVDPHAASQITQILVNNMVNDHAYWVGNDGGNGLCTQWNFQRLEAVSCDKTSEMGIICKNSDEEYVNTHKQNKMFYCDLGAIGLMDNVDGKWKEVKYLLKDCKKKRAVGEPRGMFKKNPFPRLELDCKNCKSKNADEVEWAGVECNIKCKADKTGNQLGTAKFGCEPVFDADNKVVGSRYIFDDAGFGRYQELCGGGCPMSDLKPYMGDEMAAVDHNKCKSFDLHNPGNYIPKQYCTFNCPAHHDNSVTHKTERQLYCLCESVDNKRECDWKIKKKGFPELNDRAFKAPADYTEPLLWGVTPELKCKGAITAPPNPPLPAGSFCYFPVNWGNVPFKGWTCDEGSVLMGNGDYAVPQGGKCSPVCSDGKRVDSLFSTLTCTRPVHAEQYDTAEWHKMLDKQYSYFKRNWFDTDIRWGFTGGNDHSHFDSSTFQSTDLHLAFHDGTIQQDGQCYNSVDSGCPSFGFVPGEFVDCTDANAPGSLCTKEEDACPDDYFHAYDYNAELTLQAMCRCKDTCEWSQEISKCSAAKCSVDTMPSNPAGQVPSLCTLDGVELTEEDMKDGIPHNAICKNQCQEGYGLTAGFGHPSTQCHCGWYMGPGTLCEWIVPLCNVATDDDDCATTYDQPQEEVGYCVPAVCSASVTDFQEWMNDGLYGGFIPEGTADSFDYYYDDYHWTQPSETHLTSLNCPADAIYSNTGDPNLDGMVKEGASCTLGCQDGWFVDRTSPVVKCERGFKNTWGHDYHWDIHWYVLQGSQQFDQYGMMNGDDYTGGSCGHPNWPCTWKPVCSPIGWQFHNYYTWTGDTPNPQCPECQPCLALDQNGFTEPGNYGDWSGFGECSATCGMGTQTQTRCCLSGNCVGPLEETRQCGWDNPPCKEDCIECQPCLAEDENGFTEPGVVGEWSEFGPCSETCGANGVKTRTRCCLSGNCVVPLEETINCNCLKVLEGLTVCHEVQFPCLEDCVECQPCKAINPETGSTYPGSVGQWGDWSDCSQTCSTGTQSRTRCCESGDCVVPLEETRECGHDQAPCLEDCEPCKPCLALDENGFTEPGQYGDWSGFGECSATCGMGTQTQTRCCLSGNCVGPLEETRQCGWENPPCKEDCVECQPCLAEDENGFTEPGVVGEWGEWADCSVSCGPGGTKTRTRCCISGNCEVPLEETIGCECVKALQGVTFCHGVFVPCPVECEECQPCKAINPGTGETYPGVYGEWSAFGSCSVSCGPGGVKTRTRCCESGDCEEPLEETISCSAAIGANGQIIWLGGVVPCSHPGLDEDGNMTNGTSGNFPFVG